MAYINMERNRAATLAAVGALHVGVIYALVVGLAGPVWKIIQKQPFIGEQIPLPKPSPVAIETPQSQPDQRARSQKDHPDDRQVVEVKQVFDVSNEIRLPPIKTGDGNGQVDPPVPPVSPLQTIAPKFARPMGKPGSWVTPNDYPAADLRAEHEGITRFELSIGADGKVQSCRTTISSGFASLDIAACSNLRKRGKFAPATDSTGAAVASTYTSAVHWTIPKD